MKTMKFIALLLVLLTLTASFTGCGAPEQTGALSSSESSEAPESSAAESSMPTEEPTESETVSESSAAESGSAGSIPGFIPQHEEEFPALTEEELADVGENHVLNRQTWLNDLHYAQTAYRMKHSSQLKEVQSIDIYFLDDAKKAFFMFNTVDNNTYAVETSMHIYKYNKPLIDYDPVLYTVDIAHIEERGFKKICTIDTSNHPKIIEFFNDWEGKVREDNEYKELYLLTINDLI